MSERREPKKEGSYQNYTVIDLTQEGCLFLEGLKQPVRGVKHTYGSITVIFPRGADDTTPDEVMEVAGLFHNARTGAVGKTMEDVM